jgi:SNF2 family DNA or RNA helicase
VKDDDDKVHYIKHNRLKELGEVLEEVEGKVIIWAAFREDIKAIMAYLEENFYKGCAVNYYGDTTDKDRSANLLKFENDPNCKYFVSTADTGGRSLTLVQAATTIYYSYRDNLEHWLQSQDRNHRPGQTKTVNYIIFAIRKTVDTRIMKSLLAKKDLAAEVLDSWREMLEDD